MYSAGCEGQNSLHIYGQLGLILAQIASCKWTWLAGRSQLPKTKRSKVLNYHFQVKRMMEKKMLNATLPTHTPPSLNVQPAAITNSSDKIISAIECRRFQRQRGKVCQLSPSSRLTDWASLMHQAHWLTTGANHKESISTPPHRPSQKQKERNRGKIRQFTSCATCVSIWVCESVMRTSCPAHGGCQRWTSSYFSVWMY